MIGENAKMALKINSPYVHAIGNPLTLNVGGTWEYDVSLPDKATLYGKGEVIW